MKLTKDEWKEITIFFEGIASPSLKEQFQHYQEDSDKWNKLPKIWDDEEFDFMKSIDDAQRDFQIVERLKKRIEELKRYHVEGMNTPLSERIDELQEILGEKP